MELTSLTIAPTSYFGLSKNYGSESGLLDIVLSTSSSNVSVSIMTPDSTLNIFTLSPNDVSIVHLIGSNVVSEFSTYDNCNRSVHGFQEPLGEYLVLPCHDYNISKYEYLAVTSRSTGLSSHYFITPYAAHMDCEEKIVYLYVISLLIL